MPKGALFMTDRPSSKAQTGAASEPYTEQDPLSSVLTRLELQAEIYVDGAFCGSWAVDTSGSRKMPFHIIGAGQAWLHMGSQAECLEQGDLVFFPRDAQHILSSSAQAPSSAEVNQSPSGLGDTTRLICGFFEFHNRASWPLLDALEEAVVVKSQDAASTACNALVGFMVDELNQRDAGYFSAVNRLAELLFLQLLRQQIRRGHLNTGLLKALFDPAISRALALIHQQPEQRWTLQSLAEASALGRSSFAKRFHDMVGLPAMQYLTAWRMQDATQFLTDSDFSLWEVAERCGYESEVAFRKAYKKHTGVTPGQVRKIGRAQ